MFPTGATLARRPWAPPYLVLLRAGFCLPSALRQTRCALTAPFHPYPSTRPPRLRASASLRAVYFLCHCPSSCPDRVLPGALPCGVRTFLPPPLPGLSAALRRDGDHLVGYDRHLDLTLSTLNLELRTLNWFWRVLAPKFRVQSSKFEVSLFFALDPVLLELLVEVAARGVDDLGGLGDVPAGLAELFEQEGFLGPLLELAERMGAIAGAGQ